VGGFEARFARTSTTVGSPPAGIDEVGAAVRRKQILDDRNLLDLAAWRARPAGPLGASAAACAVGASLRLPSVVNG
jgi:hypothetical protein